MNNHQRRAAAKQLKRELTEGAILRIVMEDGEPAMSLFIDGVRIAKRFPGKNWINLEPGYTVRGSEPGGDYSRLTIEYTPANAQLQ